MKLIEMLCCIVLAIAIGMFLLHERRKPPVKVVEHAAAASNDKPIKIYTWIDSNGRWRE